MSLLYGIFLDSDNEMSASTKTLETGPSLPGQNYHGVLVILVVTARLS